VITGNKSSIVYAMDPGDREDGVADAEAGFRRRRRRRRVGTATDGRLVYAALADNPARGKPGLVALDAATARWPGASMRRRACRATCRRDAASRLLPGGHGHPGRGVRRSQDGRLRAYAAADGKLLWEYDATTPMDTVNGVKGAPGGYLDMGGPTVAGGMMFVHSGYNGSAGPSNLLLAFTPDGR
jgi:polyvinyl alcohol dehydrogenase (cytochrome)